MSIHDFNIACLHLIETQVCRGDCCGLVPFPFGFWHSHRADAAVAVKQVIPFGDDMWEFIVGHDERCVFMDREHHNCRVYQDRPKLCRIFGVSSETELQCPYLDRAGSLRSRAHRRAFNRFMKKEMKKTRVRILELRG